MNKLREITISIIEDVEEHITSCIDTKGRPTEPFEEENWYKIEDIVYDKLYNYLIGDEE